MNIEQTYNVNKIEKHEYDFMNMMSDTDVDLIINTINKNYQKTLKKTSNYLIKNQILLSILITIKICSCMKSKSNWKLINLKNCNICRKWLRFWIRFFCDEKMKIWYSNKFAFADCIACRKNKKIICFHKQLIIFAAT